jgi:hypothetical protein
MRPYVICYTNGIVQANSAHMCAERLFFRRVNLEANRAGIKPHQLGNWIHRKYGDVIIERVRGTGELGTSIPCVMCRKTLDRWSIQWRAHKGNQWHRSTDVDVPESRPTHRQRQLIFN